MNETVTTLAPATPEAMLQALQGMTRESRLLAGGTDLIIALRRGLRADMLVSLENMAPLRCFEEGPEGLRLGSMLTMHALEQAPLPRCAAALGDAARVVGSYQIRNRATLGGNIANASPASDLLPVLMALDAQAVLLQADGTTASLPVKTLPLGAGKTAIPYNSLLRECVLPCAENRLSVYGKLGYRKELSVSRIGLALCVDLAADGYGVADASIYVGAIAPVPVRAEAAEAALRGWDLRREAPAAFTEALTALAAMSPRKYKGQAIRALALDVWEALRRALDGNIA